MKTCVRIGSLVIALGLAGLLAGCVSANPRTSRNARDFEIVETSTKRTLTAKEMVRLQEMVSDYLKKEGATDGGDYYVKVYLTPDKDGVPGEWVVVRYSQPTAYVATHFSVQPSDPDYGYSSYYPGYNFDYLPFGWFGFSAFALSYYDDPFYYRGYGGYYPRRNYTNYGWQTPARRHDRYPGRGNERDRKDGHAGFDHGNRSPDHRPGPATPPRVNRNRGEGDTAGRNWSPRGDSVTERTDSRPRWHGRGEGTASPTPAPAPVVTPSPAARFKPSAPPITTRAPTTTGDAGSGQRQSRTAGPREQSPSGRHRPSREDSAPSPRPDHFARERTASPGQNSPQPVPTPAYTPPAPRSESTRSYATPASRSETASENAGRGSRGQEGSRDGGRRTRTE